MAGRSISRQKPQSSFGFVALFVALFVTTSTLAQERALKEGSAVVNRIAVLIGNSAYRPSTDEHHKALNPLPNACPDVRRISALLENAGWVRGKEIIEVCNATRSAIRDAADQFRDAYLSSDLSFGFIYYAGHGVQVKSDTYLLGVDSYIDEAAAARIAVTHDGASLFPGGVRLFADVISQVGDAGSGSIFVAVDACRETPVDRVIRGSDGQIVPYLNAQRYPRPARGVKVLYSTAYGDLASDGTAGDGGGSPFSLALEESARQDGRVEFLVGRVIRDVDERTRSSFIKQIPDTTGSTNPPPPEACLTTCGVAR